MQVSNDCRCLARLLPLLLAGLLLPAVATAEDAAKPAATKDVKVGDITLTVPEDWKETEPTSRLRLAQFAVPGAEGDETPTEVVVFFFGGAGGGADANIKRWIGQFESEGRKVKVMSGKSEQGPYIIAELAGTWKMPVGPPVLRKTKAVPGAKMQSVILAVADRGNYFIRLTGPEKTVSSLDGAFRRSFGGDAKQEKEYELDGE